MYNWLRGGNLVNLYCFRVYLNIFFQTRNVLKPFIRSRESYLSNRFCFYKTCILGTALISHITFFESQLIYFFPTWYAFEMVNKFCTEIFLSLSELRTLTSKMWSKKFKDFWSVPKNVFVKLCHDFTNDFKSLVEN